MSSDAIWTPSDKRIAASNMQRFLMLNADRLENLEYASLYRWSISEPTQFWAAVWEFCGIKCSSEYKAVVKNFERMPGANWFDGATLNYAQNLLRPEFEGVALVFVNERGDRAELHWQELRLQVANVSESLRSFGVKAGDRVAGLLPNHTDAVVAALATASLGAVWSSCSPDFGLKGVLERFGQITPKVLFATDGYFYNGKSIDLLDTVAAIADRLGELQATIVTTYRDPDADIDRIPGAYYFSDIASGNAELRFEAVPASHPLCILYSSGTTGVPKCIVHSVGGTLIQHQKEHVLHTDIGPGDVVFYYTTCSWMMWNWLVSSLACGATLVLYDGAPLHPDPGVLWRIAEDESITVLGTSARYLSALEKSAYQPRDEVDLEALKTLLSTGSPLAPSSFDFVYRKIKQDVQLSSIAGGTDLISCFALGNPILPVYRGELQCRGLGMKVEIFDDSGQSVREQKGELVCTAPFPSMPIGFWNDADQHAYRAAYFDRFPKVWCHGDYAELTAHDGITIYGRSDALLNPGGVRIGTAEIYRIVEQLPEIAEAIVVGQDWDGDTRMVLFLRLQPSYSLDAELTMRVRRTIREQASPRHVPAIILQVADIPRTLSGKIVELAVRDVIHDRSVRNRDALANPQALEHFRNRPELSV